MKSHFRPLSGNYISQSLHLDNWIASVFSFPSPVGELHFSINHKLLCNMKSQFRPLSGNYISQSLHLNEAKESLLFPSPVGELHFSIRPQSGSWMQWTTIFPSPVGELHFSITTPIFKLNKKGNIFRPLSGNYISQLLMGLQSRRIGHIFSVPCRGTTFLNNYEYE